MPRGRGLPLPVTRRISRQLRQLLVVLLQKVENVFHRGTTSICETVEAHIASIIVSLDREQRDRLLLQEEGDTLQIFLDESERFDRKTFKLLWVFKGILNTFIES
jgi:hypothetical protein